MSAHEAAQHFYDQLRALNDATSGPSDLPRDQVDSIIDQTLSHLHPDLARNPRMRAEYEHLVDRMLAGESDAVFSELLTELQVDIETTAAESIRDGLDVARRPLVRHLTTGQLNAVSLRVPSDSAAYLVLLEDQLQMFASEVAKVVASAVPVDEPDAQGLVGFRMTAHDVAQRIADAPEIAEAFTTVVVTYAATGRVGLAAGLGDDFPGSRAKFAVELWRSFDYFVLGHEYAHVLLGHLDTTAPRKGVLPVATAETLVYSWQDEITADMLGAMLGIQASVNHGNTQIGPAYLGVNLFFDALDVMDRAVAVLQTGDEEGLQLGSHPPAHLRKQRLREALTKMPTLQPDSALRLAEAQEQIFRLLWERTRPVLVAMWRSGERAARTWRPIPKETDAATQDRGGVEQAAGYAQLGMAALNRDDLQKAHDYLRRALRLYDQFGDRAGSATCSCQLGIIADLQNHNADGKNYVVKALAAYTEIGDKAGAAECYYQLGGRFAADDDEAESHLEVALGIYEQLEQRSRVAVINGALGSLAMNGGRYRDSELWFARAATIYASLGDQSGVDRCRAEMDELRHLRRRSGLLARFAGRRQRSRR